MSTKRSEIQGAGAAVQPTRLGVEVPPVNPDAVAEATSSPSPSSHDDDQPEETSAAPLPTTEPAAGKKWVQVDKVSTDKPKTYGYMEISPAKGVALRTSDPHDGRPAFLKAYERNEKVSFIYIKNDVEMCCLQTQAKVAQQYLLALEAGREIRV